MKTHCIICHSDNVEASDEHVISEALGGAFHIFNVCKACNSNLGTKVDIKLVDHLLMKICREKYNLSGKTGKLPSFLCDQIVHPKTDDNIKMKFYYNENNEIKLKYLTNTENNFSEDGTGSFTITVDDSEKNKINEIINKKKSKLEKKGLKMNISEPQVHTQKGIEIQGNLTVDLAQFKIGLLKIAYESLCFLCPEYENDKNGKLLSSILLNAKYEQAIEYHVIGTGFGRIEIFDTLKCLQIDVNTKHLIYFIFLEQSGLFCFISLFDTISLGIKMSDYNYIGKYNLFVVTNDYIQKRCEKYKFTSQKGLEKL